MARNWDVAGRGGLGTLVDAYYSGQDRNRAIAKEKADSQKSGSEYAFTHTKNYQKPKLDENGFVTGYESNEDTRARNQPILKNLRPEFFREPPAPAAPAAIPQQQPVAAPVQPGPEKDFTINSNQLSPSGRPMGKTSEDYAREAGSRAPNGAPSSDPAPLLRDPKTVHIEAQIQSQEAQNAANNDARGKIEEKKLESGKRAMVGAGTEAVQYDKNDPGTPGLDANGKPVRVVNATKTIQNQQKDLVTDVPIQAGGSSATVSQSAPAAAPVNPAQYSPDDYMMGRITDMATTPSARAIEPMISGKALSGVLGRQLPDVQLPASMWRSIISGEYGVLKAQAGGKGDKFAGLSPEHIPYVQAVEAGQSPGDVFEAFQADHPQQPIPKTLTDALYKAEGARFKQEGQESIQNRFDQGHGRISRKEYMGIVGKAADQWREVAKDVLAEGQFARNAKAMANSGDTRGMVGAIRNMLARASSEKGPLSVYDVKQFGGEEGWAEQAEQFLARGANEGMTPANVKLVNRLADIYLKAAHEKAKYMAGPILGGLRARTRAYGMDPGEAENLFKEEVNMQIGGEEEAPASPAPAKATGGDKLKAQYQEAIKKIDASKANASQKRIAKQKALEFYKSKGGK